MKSNSKHTYIHPEDNSNLYYWSKKWGVSAREINNAIIDTGSLDVHEIKLELIRRRTFVPLSLRLVRFLKNPFNYNKGMSLMLPGN